MHESDPHAIKDQTALRAIYRESAVEAKKIPNLTPSTIEVLQAAPFFVLATSSSTGTRDASPRGGPPGLIQILDESTIAFPDHTGNRLIDVDQARAGLEHEYAKTPAEERGDS